MTVLAVDVSLADLLNLKKILTNVYPDINVILCSEINTDKIMQAIEKARPDCIIVEAELGNKDGISLTRTIKQKYPTAYFCITNDSGDFARQAWDIHANGYLVKPITESKIRNYFYVMI